MDAGQHPTAPDPSTDADERPIVLLTFRFFSTQHDAQGPTQSLTRMARMLGHKYRFKVLSLAMPGEREREWETVFGVERIAVRKGLGGLPHLLQVLRRTRCDLLVLNSFFDPQLTIATLVMRKLRLIPRRPTIVAPRGEFSPGALALKPVRKKAYLQFARWLGLTSEVSFQATNPLEAAAIREGLPHARSIIVAPNVRAHEPLPEHRPRKPGEPVRFVFLGRIDRKKNLHVALRLLAQSGVTASFDIVGPLPDAAYWAECQTLIAAMPNSIAVRYAGPVPATEVLATLAGYDAMLFPTAGENYGHVIVESFLAGTPVLISDQTPWLGLADLEAGADIALADQAAWLDWIRRFSEMSDEERTEWRAGARAFGERSLQPERDVQMLADCFDQVLGRGSREGR